MEVLTLSQPTSSQRGGHASQLNLPINAALLDVNQVSQLMNCSVRTIRRWSDTGRMPRPVRIGGLVRWARADLERWVADGCPPVRQRKGGVLS
ncbi:MAG: helix-turn-helix domain-containing protein [bacterium]|nr:helix-turn-helix domain-containing protein [bacterium]